jgi:hypothetical protein
VSQHKPHCERSYEAWHVTSRFSCKETNNWHFQSNQSYLALSHIQGYQTVRNLSKKEKGYSIGGKAIEIYNLCARE